MNVARAMWDLPHWRFVMSIKPADSRIFFAAGYAYAWRFN